MHPSCDSGLLHHGQRSGQPLKNTLVRIPGPSCRLQRCISKIFPFLSIPCLSFLDLLFIFSAHLFFNLLFIFFCPFILILFCQPILLSACSQVQSTCLLEGFRFIGKWKYSLWIEKSGAVPSYSAAQIHPLIQQKPLYPLLGSLNNILLHLLFQIHKISRITGYPHD